MMRVIVLFLLVGVISPVFLNTLTVYANESSSQADTGDSDETEDTNTNNRWEDLNANAFAYDNQAVAQGFIDASMYDPSMHYLMTYNTLMSKYTDVNNDSPYAQVARGADGGAYTGVIGGAVKKHLGQNDTNAELYLDKLDTPDGGEPNNGDFDGDGIIAPGEGNDTATEEPVNDEEYDKLRKQFRDDVVLILSDTIDGNLTLNTTTIEFDEAHINNISGWTKFPLAAGVLDNPRDTVSNDAKELLNTTLTNVVDEYIRSGGFRQGLDESIMNTIVQRTQSLVMDHYAEKGIIDAGNSDRGIYYRDFNDLFNEDYKRVNDGGYTKPGTNRRYAVMRLKDTDAANSMNDVKNAMSLMIYETYKQFGGENLIPFNEALDKAIKDVKGLNSYTKWKDALNRIEKSNEGFTLSTWTTLVPTPAVVEGGAVKRLKTAVEEYDGTDFSGSSYTKNGVERLLETGDIFISKSNPSPILVGSPAWYQITSMRVNQSKISAGLGGSALNSGSQNTSYYVGVKNSGLGTGWDAFGANDDINKKYTDIKEQNTPELSQGQIMLTVASSKVEEWGSRFNMEHTGTDATVGVDNYGNIISGTTGAVILPYWQNSIFPSLEGVFKGGMYFSGPIVGTAREGTHISSLLNTNFKDDIVGEKVSTNIAKVIGDDDQAKSMIETIQKSNNMPSTYDSDAFYKLLNNGIDGYTHEEVIQALAVMITASTMDTVKAFNAEMIAAATAAQRLYVFYDNKTSGVVDEELEGFRWTAASLIQKIGYIFDYGIYDTIRLTMSRTTASFYNTTIKNTGLTQVFYTDTIVNGGMSSYMTVLVASIIALVLTVYILLTALRVWRGHALLKNLVRQFLMLALVIAIPTMIYGPLTNYVLNKPTQLVLGEQMKGTVTLDTYLLLDESKRETHEFYGNMFGRNTESEDFQIGSYNLRFYTNTDEAGFNIDLVHGQDNSLSFIQRSRVQAYRKGAEYPKEHLIYADVDLLDLYKWVWDVSREGKSSDEIAALGSDWEMPEFDDETMPTLFEWLAQGGGENHKVTGYEPELGTYDEYQANLLIPLANRYPQMVDKYNEYLGSAGAIVNGFFGIDIKLDRFQLQRDDVPYITSGSELFYEIVRNSTDSNVAQNISKLAQFSDMINYTNVTADANAYIPNKEEIESVVRDLSLSNEMKDFYYGSYRYSPFSRVVIALNNTGNRYSLDDYLQSNGMDVQGMHLVTNPQFVEPEEDFLNMRGVINRVLPVLRDNTVSAELFRNDTLNGDMYDINYNLIMNYLTTYSVTRGSFGHTRSQQLLGQAEQMVLATEAFFQFNKVMMIDAFPQTYHVGSITFDKYLSMLYIPLKDYGEATLNFMDYDGVVPRSTAESIVLSSNMLELVLFLLAVMAVTLFGLLYVAMFYVILLVLILYSYLKNYVIKVDYDNKAWLGTLVIYGAFGLAKLGLTTLWWVLGKMMNAGVASSAESVVGYPHVLLHSLVVGAYSVFVIIALSKYVIKPMLQDVDNLGGQTFSQGIGRVVGALKPGSRGSRGGNTGGSSVRNARGNEGSRGRNRNKGPLTPNSLKHLGAKAASLTAGHVGGTLDKRAQAAAVGAVAGKLAQSTANGVGAVGSMAYKKLYNIDDKPVKLTKGTEKNAVDRLSLAHKVGKVNRVNSTIGGISEETLLKAGTGDVLRDIDDAFITSMDMGNAAAAAVLASNLLGRGIGAKSVGSLVYFDSTGYDLNDTNTRAELFKEGINGLQDTYQDELVEYNTKKAKGVLNYSLGGGTGINRGITLNFGKEGINGFNYDEIFNMPEFRSTFMRPAITSRNLMADGSLSGDIELELKDPTMPSTEVSKVLEGAYAKDTELRQKNDLGERMDSSFNRKMVLSQISNQELLQVEQEARRKGMLVRGRTLYYQKGNRIHQNAITEFSQRFDKKKEELSETYQQTSRNLVNYVAKGGTNGVYTETREASNSAEGTSAVYGAQSYRKGKTQVKVNPNVTNEIIRTRDGLSAIQQYNQTNGQSVFKLQEMKSAIHKSARQSLQKTTDTGILDEQVYNSQVEQFLERSSIRDSKAYVELTNKRRDLESLYSKNKISESEFLKSQSSIANSYAQLMQDTGLADEFSLGITKNKDRQVTQDYYAARDRVSEGTGVHKEDLARFRAKDLTTDSKLVTDKGALTVDKGVASISYKKDDRDLGLGVNGINGDTEQFILQTNRNKSYVEDSARELIDYYTDVKQRPDVKLQEQAGKVRRDDFMDQSLFDKSEMISKQVKQQDESSQDKSSQDNSNQDKQDKIKTKPLPTESEAELVRKEKKQREQEQALFGKDATLQQDRGGIVESHQDSTQSTLSNKTQETDSVLTGEDDLIHETVKQINRVTTLNALIAIEQTLKGQTYQGEYILLIPQVASEIARKRDLLS